MDVLNVETRWIDNKICYRMSPGLAIPNTLAVNHKSVKPVEDTFIEDEPDYDPDLPIIHANNMFYITIHCPGPLIRHIKGQKCKMLNALQMNGSTVKFIGEKTRGSSCEITVSASSKVIVSVTYHKILDIMTYNRLKDDFTHFVSLPVNTPEICSSFECFKEEILSKYRGVRGINESIFQNANKLHVTVVPLVLYDKRDTEQAAAILSESVDTVIKDFEKKDFVVDVRGIEYMNDDPAEVDVLYAKLHEPEGDCMLQQTANTIMKKFVDAKLTKNQHEKVKLHITLMNTIFRDNKNMDSERVTFDARPILKDFSDYHFGKIVISEIHISIRYTEDQGYYMASSKKKL